METESIPNEPIQGTNPLHYSGTGTELAILLLKNILLTIITLGIYAPWARTNTRRYLWGHTSFLGDRAAYTGQGKELFRGWVLVFLLYIAIAIFVRAVSAISPFITFILVPLYIYFYSIILYSGTRYRLSRTTWREVHFGLDRDKKQAREFIILFVKGIIFSILSLGFYYPFHVHNTRKFITNKSRFGSAYFSYEGKNNELFKLYLSNLLFTIISFGIYTPWAIVKQASYRLNNTRIGNAKIELTMKGSDLFFYSLCSYFLVLFTIGLALPWVINWGHRLVTNAIVINGEIDLNAIHNIASDGEAMADVAAMEYNIDLGF